LNSIKSINHITSYGAICNASLNSNKTKIFQEKYNNKCLQYIKDTYDLYSYVDAGQEADPAFGCGKDLKIEYTCPDNSNTTTSHTPGEANGKQFIMNCNQ